MDQNQQKQNRGEYGTKLHRVGQARVGKTHGHQTVSDVIPCADFEYRHKNYEF